MFIIDGWVDYGQIKDKQNKIELIFLLRDYFFGPFVLGQFRDFFVYIEISLQN